MIDWMQEHAWATWLGLAVVLALIELVSLDLVLLMFAIGALSAAVVAAVGGPVWLAIVVFALVSVMLLFLVRPPVVEKLHAGPTLKTGPEALVGATGIVVEPVTPLDGRILLRGEIWSARAMDDAAYETGHHVLVTQIDGATAVVTSKEI
ncbi:NfeD family protein [Aeromicrobium sp. SMF47]|uniref:NfeD family protein n=1 Tax=Aeromicrobium yanjiei TaxID=2662028 RepID=A0A5Q2MLT0_9ACTN|nr:MULTISPECIES: NfeD family protein [Aeromicrobium]MRJ77562.1 NfeD family protein [Aeromicrobium yanjiei]MRK01930.1 NfeD family protein [Aeromicrobium sp. S22]QGG41335.1 NfeD family protein [Aeromicrobium yanjiei]